MWGKLSISLIGLSIVAALALHQFQATFVDDSYFNALHLFDTKISTTPPPASNFHKGTIAFDPLWLDFRRRFQGRWTAEEKGWLVPLKWGYAPKHGSATSVGVYAVEEIKKGTLVRKSAMDENLDNASPTDVTPGAPGVFLRIRSYEDLEKFTRGRDGKASKQERAALMKYVSDYLFVAKPAFGHEHEDDPAGKIPEKDRYFGMWVPGCTDNDANPDEVHNVEDRLTPMEEVLVGGKKTHIQYMGMYANRDIKAGELVLSDYDGAYGVPPKWAAEFANTHMGGWLAFKGHNHKAIKVKEDVSGA